VLEKVVAKAVIVSSREGHDCRRQCCSGDCLYVSVNVNEAVALAYGIF